MSCENIIDNESSKIFKVIAFNGIKGKDLFEDSTT